METEVWPNLLHAARSARRADGARQRAPEREAAGARAQRLDALMRPARRALALVLAQTDGRRAAPARGRRAQRRGERQPEVRHGRPTPTLLARGRAWRDALDRAGACSPPSRAKARRRCCSRLGGARARRRSAAAAASCRATRSASTRSPRSSRGAGLTLARRSRWGERRRDDGAAPPMCGSATRWARWRCTTRGRRRAARRQLRAARRAEPDRGGGVRHARS